jgi:hypothetical protein
MKRLKYDQFSDTVTYTSDHRMYEARATAPPNRRDPIGNPATPPLSAPHGRDAGSRGWWPANESPEHDGGHVVSRSAWP